MTRIGFAYNQKPESSTPASRAAAEASRPDEEPPSSRRDASSRTSDSPAEILGMSAGGALGSPSPSPSPSPTAVRGATTALLTDEFAEWDSADTIDAIAGALSALGEVVRLEATAEFPERLRSARPDIVFNAAEGLTGMNREAHVPAICEFFGIPYTGSDPFTLSLCLHKARTKEVLSYHGVDTAAFALVESMADLAALRRRLMDGAKHSVKRDVTTPLGERQLAFPLFVKPAHEGSSKGITERNLCRDFADLAQQVELLLAAYEQPVLVEDYLPGAEFTCAVLGNGSSARVLPLIGMDFSVLPKGAIPIYGYEAKWLWDRPEHPLEIFTCPAPIEPSLANEIERIALRAYHVLGCRDWARIDVRLDAAGRPNIVEVNPLPGVLPDPADNSCLPKAARVAGLGYDELIQSCLLAAAERCRIATTAPHRARLAASG